MADLIKSLTKIKEYKVSLRTLRKTSSKFVNELYKLGFKGPFFSLKPCCMSYSIQLFHTFLCNSQNYHPRGAVVDPMHCCPRPKAEGNSASSHPQQRGGDSFDCCTERYEIVVLLPNSEDTCYCKCFLKFE